MPEEVVPLGEVDPEVDPLADAPEEVDAPEELDPLREVDPELDPLADAPEDAPEDPLAEVGDTVTVTPLVKVLTSMVLDSELEDTGPENSGLIDVEETVVISVPESVVNSTDGAAV